VRKKLIKKAIDLDPRKPTNYELLARLYSFVKSHENAEKAVNASISLLPTRSQPYFIKAEILGNQGRYEEAIMILNELKPLIEDEKMLNAINEKILEYEANTNNYSR